MNFNNENEDLIQYYYVNKVAFNRPQNSGWLCSTFSSLYVSYGQALNMFLVLYDLTFSHFWTKNHKYSFETRFTECVGTEVFGIHTVVYFRRIYDEKMKSSVMQEVKHPDTIYVLPDLPYSYRMDNATKTEMEKMRPKLQKMDLNYLWSYNCLSCCLHIRVVSELIVVLFFTVLFIRLVSKCEQAYTCIMLQPIRRMILGQTLNDGGCPTLTQAFSYSSYIFCGNTDRDSVHEHLVVPLRKEYITTGFIFEECLINNSGKSIFDIQSELLQQCEHLVSYVTSSYLNEENFVIFS